ncbi:MAG: class I SAM-dependent methyltransferase [Patescibacteria group bacterium]
MDFKIEITKPEAGYELLDSGEGEKLERYGDIIVSRPDPQALWKRSLPETEWKKAKAVFLRTSENARWEKSSDVPERWEIELAGLKFWIRPTTFKHTGLFPEHVPNWNWIQDKVKNAGRPIKVLNLFGYTGGATLAAAQAGAEVVHVDGSKTALTWARENAEISGLSEKPIRWILDDARVFVHREIKRGNKYDAIIMDPPAFGHGADKEVWKIEDDLLPLLEECKQILSDQPLFFIINGYASGYSAIAYKNNLDELMKAWKGKIEIGELTIQETSSQKLLPSGIFARWSA